METIDPSNAQHSLVISCLKITDGYSSTHSIWLLYHWDHCSYSYEKCFQDSLHTIIPIVVLNGYGFLSAYSSRSTKNLLVLIWKTWLYFGQCIQYKLFNAASCMQIYVSIASVVFVIIRHNFNCLLKHTNDQYEN